MNNMEITFENLPKAVTNLTYEVSEIKRLLLSKSSELPQDQPEKLLTIQEAAQFLNLAVPTIYSKVSKKELPFMKRSKRLYFSKIELLDYIKSGRIKTNEELADEAHKFVRNTRNGRTK